MRRVVDATALPEWAVLVRQVRGAFEYLETRLTDQCASPYHCQELHRRSGLLRAFNPAFAQGKVDALWVHQLVEIPAFSHLPSVTQRLLDELPTYLTACRGTRIDHTHVPTFTKEVLAWWASNKNKSKSPTWALAARIAFSMTPNSAACERVFSLLTTMFGPDRSSSLADRVQAAWPP